MRMKIEKEHESANSFAEIPSALSAEGWALDRDRKRFRIGYIQGIWWYEEGGFCASRVYRDKKYIEKSFVPLTRLRAVKKRAGVG